MMLTLAWIDASGFQWLELAVTAALPLALIYFGYRIQDLQSNNDHRRWISQKVIEKRIEVLSQMGPIANDLYCYFLWIGRWKEIRPDVAISMKRQIDTIFFVNRYLFSTNLCEKYQYFMEECFKTFQGANTDAKLRTHFIHGQDRRAFFPDEWDSTWDERFTKENPRERAVAVDIAYQDLMQAFRAELEVGTDAEGVET